MEDASRSCSTMTFLNGRENNVFCMLQYQIISLIIINENEMRIRQQCKKSKTTLSVSHLADIGYCASKIRHYFNAD